MPRLVVGMCPALTQNVVTSLENVGIRNVVDFVASDVEELVGRSGVPYKDLTAIRRVVLAQYAPFPLNATDMYEDLVSTVTILSTGCNVIDNLLDGGLYSGEVTEVIGQAGSGKSQLCMSMCLSVTMETPHTVLYVDTGGGFDVTRLQVMMEERGLQESKVAGVCQRLRCCPVFDVFELLGQLEQAREALTLQNDAFFCSLKLVVVDSVAAVLSPIVGGQGSEGHSYMMHVARALKTLSTEFSIAVLMTNNVSFDERSIPRPTLGRSWRHVPHARLLVERRVSYSPTVPVCLHNERTLTLVKSTRQAVNGKVLLKITDRGVDEMTS